MSERIILCSGHVFRIHDSFGGTNLFAVTMRLKWVLNSLPTYFSFFLSVDFVPSSWSSFVFVLIYNSFAFPFVSMRHKVCLSRPLKTCLSGRNFPLNFKEILGSQVYKSVSKSVNNGIFHPCLDAATKLSSQFM